MFERRSITVAAVALLLCASGASAADGLRPADDDSPLGTERLSNETTLTRFAHALSRAKVRSTPSRTARTLASMRVLEDGSSTKRSPPAATRSRIAASRWPGEIDCGMGFPWQVGR